MELILPAPGAPLPAFLGFGRERAADVLRSLALSADALSPDPRTKTGAALLALDGSELLREVNLLPPNVLATPWRLASPEKYHWIEHAERALVYKAARRGLPLEGLVAACTLFPCADCARALALCGFRALLTARPDERHASWHEHFKRSAAILSESKVELVLLEPEDLGRGADPLPAPLLA